MEMTDTEKLAIALKALRLLANKDRSAAGDVVTDEVDRMGYPVIEHHTEIAQAAIQQIEAIATSTQQE